MVSPDEIRRDAISMRHPAYAPVNGIVFAPDVIGVVPTALTLNGTLLVTHPRKLPALRTTCARPV